MAEFCLRLLILMLVRCFVFADFVSSETKSGDRSVSSVVNCPAPQPCECERTPGRLVLNCREQNLDQIPRFSHSDERVDELTLAGNRLVALPNDAFRGLKIHRLDLTDNHLANVSLNAFSGLEPHLEELLIQLDWVAEFPSEAVAPLTLLKVLNVIGYARTSLPQGALRSFRLVRELRLTRGRLQSLSPADVFAMRTSLSVVELSSNPLGSVPTAALATLNNLTEVSLSGCRIARLGARAFATNRTGLRRIDLSQNQLEVRISKITVLLLLTWSLISLLLGLYCYICT